MNVEAHEWYRFQSEGPYRADIPYEIELKDKPNLIDADSICVFFHRKIKFTFSLSLDKDSAHLKAFVGFDSSDPYDSLDFFNNFTRKAELAKESTHCCDSFQRDEDSESDHDSYDEWHRSEYPGEYSDEDSYDGPYPQSEDGLCREYIWVLDKCVVKMIFMNQNNDKSFTKRLNPMEFVSSKSKDNTAFKELMLISKEDLKSKLDFDADSAQGDTFLHVKIEISARVYLEGWIYEDKRSIAEDDEHCLITSPGVSLTATNKRMKLSNFAHSHQGKLGLRPDDENCDLVLQIGPDGKTCISVHKAVLATKSTVFFTMFFGKHQGSTSGNLKLEDSTFAGVLAFVNFLYHSNANIGALDDFEWDVNASLDVLKLAQLYQIKDLVEFCLDKIFVAPNSELSVATALQILKWGELLNAHDLSARSLQWIKSNREDFDSESNAKLDDFMASSGDKEKLLLLSSLE